MIRRTVPSLLIALSLGAAAGQAQAQIGFVVGGGPSIPLGDFGDFAQSGWMALGGAQLGFPLIPVKFRLDGLYGQNTHDDPSDDKTVLYGVVGNVILQIGPPLVPVKPYLIAGAGYLNHRFSSGTSGIPSEGEWKGVFGGGAGLSVSLVVVGAFVEARWLRRDDTTFLPIIVGLRLGG